MYELPDFTLMLATEGRNFASLATVMPDGSPQVSLVWIDSDGDHLLVNTAEGTLKLSNIRRDPRVGLSIVKSSNPYNQVMIRGRVVEITHDGADKHMDRLAKKYLGEDKYEKPEPGEKRVIMKISPEYFYNLS